MIDVDEVRHELKAGLPYLAELVFRVANATTDAPNAEVPGGQALYMTGPTADPEAIGHKERGIAMGMLDEGIIELERPGDPPAVAFWLNDWESQVRQIRDDEPLWALDRRAPFSIKYLLERVDWMLTEVDGELQYPPAVDRAHELRHLIRRLEDAIHDGIRDDTGAPCELCARPLVKEWADKVLDDRWTCHACGLVLATDEYVATVRRNYLANATTLSAADAGERLGIAATRIRVWGSRFPQLKAGQDANGITLYDVAAVASKFEEVEARGEFAETS